MPNSVLEQMVREAVAQGRLIEAGWLALRIAALPADAEPDELGQFRNMFFAGARHLFASIITVLDPGTEPTPDDLVRMTRIDAELKAFIADFTARHLPTKGSA